MFPANSISMFHTEHWCKVDPIFLMRSGFTFCIHCVCFCQHHAKLELPKKLTTTVCFVCLETRLKNYWGQCWGFCFSCQAFNRKQLQFKIWFSPWHSLILSFFALPVKCCFCEKRPHHSLCSSSDCELFRST
jgi:hypothetical protein